VSKSKQRLDDGSTAEDKRWTKQSLHTLREKVECNNQIIELLGSSESEDVKARIEKEIEDSHQVREELTQVVLRREEVLSPISAAHPKAINVAPPTQTENPVPGSSKQQNVKAKLPRLEVKKFSSRLNFPFYSNTLPPSHKNLPRRLHFLHSWYSERLRTYPPFKREYHAK